jgi:hypothetical protein
MKNDKELLNEMDIGIEEKYEDSITISEGVYPMDFDEIITILDKYKIQRSGILRETSINKKDLDNLEEALKKEW